MARREPPKLTKDEASETVRELQMMRKPRAYARSPLDFYKEALMTLRAAGGSNADVVLWLRRQTPRVVVTRTKVRAWYKRQDKLAEMAAAETAKRDS